MSIKGQVLVVDDEEIMRDVLSALLSSESYAVGLAGNGSQALEMIRDKDYGVMLLDLMMPEVDGFQVLEKLKKIENGPVPVVLTAYASIDRVMQAAKLNAFAFIPKPFKNDELLLAVKNAMEQHNLALENQRLKKSLHERYGFQSLIGKSAAMQQVFDLIAQVAPRRSTVLVQGESGTGKELVAKAIHASSDRMDAPFIAINCGNIPSDLLESELFGHVRGAYTGATSAKKGLFEAADGGTLFLDEVSTISQDIQVKLLRVIQEREFRRLGSLENIQIDVRIIAATNTDLQVAVRQGAFRDDLYYRLNVIVIKIPPLRDRAEDIPLLARHFIKKYGEENQRDGLSLEPSALRVLMEYPWPGNVRELENVIERAVVLSQESRITADLFPKNITLPYPETPDRFVQDNASLKEKVGNFEKSIILAALEKTGWNQKKAAQLLSVNATTLSEKLKRFKIRGKGIEG
ncbi:MAG: sigma-54-dependent Fis family transcriptional regulator [Acidobacteria bacterium]|nr:sigma-54-dependent Fis family transcriptional regulator [Acidobacteriota bacterium]